MKSIGIVILKLLLSAGIILLLVFLIVNLDSRPYIYTSPEKLPHVSTVVILGASVLPDKTLSPVLEDRVKTAITVYREGAAKTILVTGDDGSLSYNEVTPIQNALILNGIPEEDIFLDYAGFDTYSSMYRARDIFLADSILIVSQSFHLPRAVFIARHLGVDAYGISADNGNYLLRNYARELLADTKAVFDLSTKRQPKYLGEKMPIP